jgi:hypothetical protein
VAMVLVEVQCRKQNYHLPLHQELRGKELYIGSHSFELVHSATGSLAIVHTMKMEFNGSGGNHLTEFWDKVG